MKIDENLAAVHAYLCADGYVIKNPEDSKYNYFHIGLRNTNLALLKDFQEKFEKVFCIRPHLVPGQRCRIGSKEVYEKLTKQFGSFYSWEWRMPKMNKKLSKIWLRTYFDCEGWVTCKSHQNRMIGADCVNEAGIMQIKEALKNLGITVKIKKRTTRNIFSLAIFGRENLIKFNEKIGFLHSEKKERLSKVLADFVEYDWKFPKTRIELENFVSGIIRSRAKMKKNNWVVRIISNRVDNLLTLHKGLSELFGVESKVNKNINGIGTVYYELSINKKAEVAKLINADLLNKTEEEKWSKLKK